MKYIKYMSDFFTKSEMRERIIAHMRNDMGTILDRNKYPYPTLFIAGLPKSGTTWLTKSLIKLPGYNLRRICDPKRVTFKHDVCDSVFSTLPHRGYNVLKLHTRYTPENFRIITRYVPRFIVMYRDLRDMCISRYYHVKSEQGHRHFTLYNELTQDEGIMHCIGVVEDLYVDWVRDWLRIAQEHPDTIYLVRYEDMNRSTYETMRGISQSFHLNMTEQQLRDCEASKIKKAKNMSKTRTHTRFNYMVDTARSGKIGGWKAYFNDQHIAKFKDIAGQLLIDCGYESDLNWSN